MMNQTMGEDGVAPNLRAPKTTETPRKRGRSAGDNAAFLAVRLMKIMRTDPVLAARAIKWVQCRPHVRRPRGELGHVVGLIQSAGELAGVR
jgi:hypothetical protein